MHRTYLVVHPYLFLIHIFNTFEAFVGTKSKSLDIPTKMTEVPSFASITVVQIIFITGYPDIMF